VTDPEGFIKVEMYFPSEAAITENRTRSVDGKLPAHVDYHGGGFVLGGLKADESWCRQMCEAVGAIFFNVDYRLAPEYPHPVPINDSWTAFKWLWSRHGDFGMDPTRISVGGLSAGGNIAAIIAILARDAPEIQHPLVMQFLIVPVIDVRYVPAEGASLAPSQPYQSYHTNEFAPMLPLARLVWFYNLWLGPVSGKSYPSPTCFQC
jgi:acetyl esterase/lipase